MTYAPSFFNKESSGSSRQTITNLQNGYGSGLAKGTPVSVNSSGQLVMVDITSDASVQAIVGMTGINIPNGAIGAIVDNGRLEDITTAFSIGDPVWIGTNGMLTNIKPDYGVGSFAEGYFVVFIGVIVKNEFNPSLKDIKLMISVVGQL